MIGWPIFSYNKMMSLSPIGGIFQFEDEMVLFAASNNLREKQGKR